MEGMLILASQSPRRAELLRRAGIPFVVRPADIDETQRDDESPQQYVTRLAREKALAALAAAPEADALVLGADTTVVLDEAALGKPRDAEEARQMLRRLAGRTHRVLTGVCLARHAGAPQLLNACETTEVEFAAIDDEEIAAYVASGEPMDKAGAYAIQGGASRWIPRIRGCYFNVVGLPVARVWSMLRQMQ